MFHQRSKGSCQEAFESFPIGWRYPYGLMIWMCLKTRCIKFDGWKHHFSTLVWTKRVRFGHPASIVKSRIIYFFSISIYIYIIIYPILGTAINEFIGIYVAVSSGFPIWDAQKAGSRWTSLQAWRLWSWEATSTRTWPLSDWLGLGFSKNLQPERMLSRFLAWDKLINIQKDVENLWFP